MARGIETKGGHAVLWTDTPEGRVFLDADRVMLRASDARVLIADAGGVRPPTEAEYDMAGLLPLVEQQGVLRVGA